MKKKWRVACLQNNAGNDWEKNLIRLDRLIQKALLRRPDLIALPETFYFRGKHHALPQLAHEVTPAVLRGVSWLAKATGTAFLLGSLAEASSEKKRYYNTSYLISNRGKIVGHYRKIHLFDIQMKGKVVVQESRYIKPGNRIVSAQLNGVKMGMTICYDLRFPEIFRQLSKSGSRIIFVPANFTEKTGQAHWHLLLRARAVENQTFIVAPGQTGSNPETGIQSYGHSLIIDPWGTVLAEGSKSREEVIWADLDLRAQDKLRSHFPVLKHRRF